MRNDQSIALLELRLNRMERNQKENYNICRKIRRKIECLKAEAETGTGVYQSQAAAE